jgi:hypothetical protein
VFQSGRAGDIVRAHRVGVDPRTPAQVWSRARLSAAARGWHSQSDAAKAAWDTYAATFYSPRDGRAPGVAYTGQQAYTGARYSAMCARNTAASLVLVTDPPGSSIVTGNQAIPTNAPAIPYAATWEIEGNPRALQLLAAEIALPNTVRITIGWESGIIASGPPITSDTPSGEFSGFHVLLSLQSPQTHGWQPRRRSIALVTCPPITAISNWTPSDHVTIELTPQPQIIERLKQFPLPGGAWRLTCVAISNQSAQLKVIGEVAVNV